MKKAKIIVIVLFDLFVLVFAIKSQIRLVKQKDRIVQHYHIHIDCGKIRQSTIEEIAEYAKKATADKLRFAKNNDIANCKANCVGYAQYASALCNQLFKCRNMSATAKPVVGYYYFGSVNMHEWVVKIVSDQQTKNFIKDHDYVEIIGSSGEVVYSFDPSVYDLTYMDFHE